MKNWFWRRFVIVLLAIVLPVATVSASLAPSYSHGNHVAALGVDHAADLTNVDELTCPAASEIDQPANCANMGHSCASCMAIVPPTLADAPPLAISVHVRPIVLEPSSFIPPSLERPPAPIAFLA